MGAQIWAKWAKIESKIRFLSFFQVWFISFPENCIAWKLGRLLIIIRSKIYEKKFQGFQIVSEVRGSFTIFSRLHHQFSLILHKIATGRMSNIYQSWNLNNKKKKHCGPNCGQNDLFYSNVIEGPLKLVCFCFYLLHFSFIWFTLILVRNSSINSLVQSN